MGSSRIYKEVINGRMTTACPRRDCVDVLVYAGAEEEGEPVGDWAMPRSLRNDLPYAAQLAERQTDRPDAEKKDEKE